MTLIWRIFADFRKNPFLSEWINIMAKIVGAVFNRTTCNCQGIVRLKTAPTFHHPIDQYKIRFYPSNQRHPRSILD